MFGAGALDDARVADDQLVDDCGLEDRAQEPVTLRDAVGRQVRCCELRAPLSHERRGEFAERDLAELDAVAGRRVDVEAKVALVGLAGAGPKVGSRLEPRRRVFLERDAREPRVDEVTAVLVGLDGVREPVGVLAGREGLVADVTGGRAVTNVVADAARRAAAVHRCHRSSLDRRTVTRPRRWRST